MITVGQKLWYGESRLRRNNHEVTVASIGRKWAKLAPGLHPERIDKVTLQADGGEFSSPGRCYLSRDDYEEEVLRANLWDQLRRQIPHGAPASITTEGIYAFAEMFGITLAPNRVQS